MGLDLGWKSTPAFIDDVPVIYCLYWEGGENIVRGVKISSRYFHPGVRIWGGENIVSHRNWTPKNKLQWNVNRNSYIFIQENPLENVVWKMAAILSRPQCVNSSRQNDTNIITIIGSGIGLSPFRHQVIIWTNISMSKTISFQPQYVNGSCCYFWNGAVMYLWV